MAVLNGTYMRVVVNGTTMAATKSFTLTITKTNRDTSNKDSGIWPSRASGRIDWTVNVDSLYDPAGVYNWEQIYDALVATSNVYLEMAVIDGTGGGEVYKGYALPKEGTLTAPDAENATTACQFEASGELEKGTVASS